MRDNLYIFDKLVTILKELWNLYLYMWYVQIKAFQ